MDLSVDAESIGLHDDIFAVGAAVFDRKTRRKVDTFYASYNPDQAMGPDSSREWVTEHVLPALPRVPTHVDRTEMLQAFWTWYRTRCDSDSTRVIADCGNAIEARLFSECIRMAPADRAWQGPYPLHEVATLRQAAGFDPIGTFPRIKADEFPVHHPVADACQSYRLWCEAEDRIRSNKNRNVWLSWIVALLLIVVMFKW